jgi:gas vesicle protein
MATLCVVQLRCVCLMLVLALARSAVAEGFAGGTGEPNDPYQIATAEQLLSVGSDPNLLNKYFVLVADIDLTPNLLVGRVPRRGVITPVTVPGGNRVDSFSGAIVGGLITLAGVLITLRWNQRSNEAKAIEERRKTKEEREFSSRQAAFMAVSEAVIRYIHYFLSLADRALPVDGAVVEEVTMLGVALSRLHFYCSLPTIEKAARLSCVLDSAFAEALKAKMAPSFLAEDLKCIELELSALENTNAHIQEEIKAILQSDPQSPLIMSHRTRSAEIYQKMAAICETKCDIIRKQYIETEKCREVIRRNTKVIYESSRDFLLLARRELSFPIEETMYKDVMDRHIREVERQQEDTFAEIRRQCLERMDNSEDGVT